MVYIVFLYVILRDTLQTRQNNVLSTYGQKLLLTKKYNDKICYAAAFYINDVDYAGAMEQ